MSFLRRLLGTDEDATAALLGDPARVAEVQSVLTELAPLFALDGGSFELVAVEDGWVRLRARGACAGCHAQRTTLSEAVEARLRERCAWLQGVRAV